MNQADFRSHYERLNDDELLSVAADREHLVPEAAAALDSEVRKRGVKPQEHKWLRESGSDERVRSLQDYDWYQQLVHRQRSMRKYGYLLVMGPFLVAIAVATTLFRKSQLSGALIVALTLIWALLVASYSLALIVRFAFFKCPQCGHRFGTDGECWSCGFPRSPRQ